MQRKEPCVAPFGGAVSVVAPVHAPGIVVKAASTSVSLCATPYPELPGRADEHVAAVGQEAGRVQEARRDLAAGRRDGGGGGKKT